MNLVRDPWVPVLFVDGRRAELGLDELFAGADTIADVEGDAPHVRLALLRLLVAILHRALHGPRDYEEWEALLWSGKGGFDKAAEYVHQHEASFELLDPRRPFLQCPSLPDALSVPVAKLVPSLASGNNRVWFDHTSVRRPAALTAAEAARWLVALQAFDPGGLKTGFPSGRMASQDAPLAGQLVVMPEGSTLARTLALNATVYDPARGLPSPGSARDADEDLPVWERDPPGPGPSSRAPTGYVDWLTWPARRVKLIPSVEGAAIDRVVITPGDRLPDTVRPEDYETFVPQHQRSRDVAFSLLRFQTDRAAWLASAAVLARRAGPSALSRRAPIVDHLDHLVERGAVAERAALPVTVGGLALDRDRAKVLAWGEERLSPLAELLADERAGEILARAVELAEELEGPLERTVAKALGAPRRGSRRRGTASHFFSRLGLAFERFLVSLTQDPVRAAEEWADAVRRSIDEVWGWAVPARVSAHELRAAVMARAELDRAVQRQLERFVSDARARAASTGVSGA